MKSYLVIFRWKAASDCWRSSHPAVWRDYSMLSGLTTSWHDTNTCQILFVNSPFWFVWLSYLCYQIVFWADTIIIFWIIETAPSICAGIRPNILMMRLPPSRSKTCCSQINQCFVSRTETGTIQGDISVMVQKEQLNKPVADWSLFNLTCFSTLI